MNAFRRPLLQAGRRKSSFHSARTRMFVTCRGEPIAQSELFTYSNGRFLVNERYETSRRHVLFNLDSLCDLVSSIPSIDSPVASIDKVEGGFNKALLMRMANGKEVVVKIPFPAIVSPKYSIESEAAVLEFVRSRTSIPVPDVLAWNSDASNPIAAEYIILEKNPGRQLHDVWGGMSELDRFKLIKTLSQFDSQLAAIEFPGYGNLYYRNSSPENAILLDTSIDPEGIYCLGPAYNASWPSTAAPSEGRNTYAGPWNSLSALGLALAKRGAWHLKHTNFVGSRGPHFGSSDEHIQHLEAAMRVIPILAATPLLERYAKPVLWHADLHLGNIFVSETDATDIVGVIDWQFTTILPRFTQVQWPLFLEPPENYEIGAIKPELPPDLEAMDPDEQAYARSQRDQAMLAKCYEAALSKAHRESYLALTQIHETLRRLFIVCENTYKDGVVPLRDCLVQIVVNWHRIGFPGNCPLEFSKEELTVHEKQLTKYQNWLKLRKCTQDILCSDDDGWVPPQVNFEKIQAKEKELFELYLHGQPPGTSEEEARKLWFYDDRG